MRPATLATGTNYYAAAAQSNSWGIPNVPPPPSPPPPQPPQDIFQVYQGAMGGGRGRRRVELEDMDVDGGRGRR